MVNFNAQDILTFWFEEIDSKSWWIKDQEFDLLITKRFSSLLEKAKQCELFEWRATPQGRLAEIIVLDQFSRNIYRDKAEAFEADPLALALAQEAVALGVQNQLISVQSTFLLMPYMHSESLKIHDIAVTLFTENGEESNLDFEHKHRNIIKEFGRYPHRNTILNRQSTPEEVAFLKQPGSSF